MGDVTQPGIHRKPSRPEEESYKVGDGSVGDTKDVFPGVCNPNHTFPRGRGTLAFNHPHGGHFIKFQLCVMGKGKTQFISSLPVIKYTEEAESPFVGDGIEGTQSPSRVQNKAVLVDSSLGEQTSKPNHRCVMPSSATHWLCVLG